MEKRRSGRVSSSSFRMPSQMKGLFFGDGASRSTLPKKLEQIHSGPNVYLVHDFLSKGELDYFDLMCTHYDNHFQSSFTGTDDDDEVISEERTSEFIHLSKGQDKFVRGIEQKAACLVGLSPVNAEPLQVVRYGPVQRFSLHHDAGTLLEDGAVAGMIKPRRLITFFLYLNSLPEGEGHTEFPRLGLSVRPRRNTALLFCNTTSDTTVPDSLAVHAAQPISLAPCSSAPQRKWGVNIWLTDSDLSALSLASSCTPLPPSGEAAADRAQQDDRKRKRACDVPDSGEGVLARAERQYAHWLQRKGHTVTGL